ncbi:MAG: hypothetical protein QM534_10450 [Sediminibacterium sp.]|nr:hypothetical protein [Sediminibacterium sp.]
MPEKKSEKDSFDYDNNKAVICKPKYTIEAKLQKIPSNANLSVIKYPSTIITITNTKITRYAKEKET